MMPEKRDKEMKPEDVKRMLLRKVSTRPQNYNPKDHNHHRRNFKTPWSKSLRSYQSPLKNFPTY
jgi:hypothetical protein